jgi:multidrug resistance efflux pump
MAESNAISDMARLQSELAIANLRAPADGFVRQQFYAVGAKARKRKPLVSFVEAQKTVLEATVPAAEAGPFAVGSVVRVADAGNAARGFRGRVLAADPAGDAVALRIQPLDLPFLALDSPASVSLSVAP